MCFHVYVGVSWLGLISKLSGVRAERVLVRLLLTLASECLWHLGVRGLAPAPGLGLRSEGEAELG